MSNLSVALLAVAACGRIGFSQQRQAGDAAPAPSGDADTGQDAPGPDAATFVVPSCVGLAPTCGPSGTSPCCSSPLVPGGTFYRSYDVGSDGLFASQAYPATIDDFRLDTYEVTVGRFRTFVAAGMGTQLDPPGPNAGAHASIPNSGWGSDWNQYLVADTTTLITDLKCNASFQTWTDSPGSNENLPMNCITWYEAFAFCAWDGGYMPTEAEWNYAAAGGDEQRAYPWSSGSAIAIDCSHANYEADATGYCVNPPNGGLMPVGSYSPAGDGRWGQADLAGSLWEKTLDSYDAPYLDSTCDDCADLTSITARSVRGGAFNGDESTARTAARYYDPPTDRYIEMGVRCARAP